MSTSTLVATVLESAISCGLPQLWVRHTCSQDDDGDPTLPYKVTSDRVAVLLTQNRIHHPAWQFDHDGRGVVVRVFNPSYNCCFIPTPGKWADVFGYIEKCLAVCPTKSNVEYASPLLNILSHQHTSNGTMVYTRVVAKMGRLQLDAKFHMIGKNEAEVFAIDGRGAVSIVKLPARWGIECGSVGWLKDDHEAVRDYLSLPAQTPVTSGTVSVGDQQLKYVTLPLGNGICHVVKGCARNKFWAIIQKNPYEDDGRFVVHSLCEDSLQFRGDGPLTVKGELPNPQAALDTFGWGSSEIYKGYIINGLVRGDEHRRSV